MAKPTDLQFLYPFRRKAAAAQVNPDPPQATV